MTYEYVNRLQLYFTSSGRRHRLNIKVYGPSYPINVRFSVVDTIKKKEYTASSRSLEIPIYIYMYKRTTASR